MPTVMAETRPLIGVVLAGGQSSRMGRDKAMLDWQGRPLIERQMAALDEAGCERVLVSGSRQDHDAIPDAVPGKGPVGGLAGMARAITGEAQLLVIPVDMPRLDAALLRTLAENLPEARCLRFADRILPMRLRLDAATRDQLAAVLVADEPRQRSLRALQQAVGTAEIDLPPGAETQLVDCNTPERFQEAQP